MLRTYNTYIHTNVHTYVSRPHCRYFWFIFAPKKKNFSISRAFAICRQMKRIFLGDILGVLQKLPLCIDDVSTGSFEPSTVGFNRETRTKQKSSIADSRLVMNVPESNFQIEKLHHVREGKGRQTGRYLIFGLKHPFPRHFFLTPPSPRVDYQQIINLRDILVGKPGVTFGDFFRAIMNNLTDIKKLWHFS